MKDINFIPEWYTAHRRRKRRYIRQCTLTGVLFTLMMIWSFVVGAHVEQVDAGIRQVDNGLSQQAAKAEQASLLQQEIAMMESKVAILDDVTPRTPLSAVIGELSCLIQNNIVLKKLSVTDEPVDMKPRQSAETAPNGAVVRAAAGQSAPAKNRFDTPTRLKLTLSGIAAGHADAAGLISLMEKSGCFQDVTLVYSKPDKVRDHDIAEFQIVCYVADYQLVQ